MQKIPEPPVASWMRVPIVLVAALLLLSVWGCFKGEKKVGEKSNSRTNSHVEQSQNSSGDLPTLANSLPAGSDISSRLIDPNQDGWVTEALSDKSKKRLELILSQLAASAAEPNRSFFKMIDQKPPSQPLRQVSKTAFQDSSLRVMRPTQQMAPERQGTLVDALRKLVAPLIEVGTPEFHVKVIRVSQQVPVYGVGTAESKKGQVLTTCLYEAESQNEQTAIQQTATLICHWDNRSDGLLLTRIQASNFEEVRLTGNQGKWFVDCTETVIGSEPAFREQLAFGTNHWMERIERAHGMDDAVQGAGLAIGDANGDGLDDVYVCQGPGLPNRLFQQNEDGTVSERSADAGVDWLDQTSAALFLDLDNDGDQDLAIATKGGLLIMENDGEGVFSKRTELAEQMTDVQSLTSADYDLDGDLDLFLCAYRHVSGRLRGEFVFHDATTGGRNYLYRNDIEQRWRFTDVTQEVGLDEGSTRYTFAAAWEDYDNDGDPDLYVANDYGPNFLFRNDNGIFTNQTEGAGLMDTGFGMSVSWGDYDRDGRMDLYIGNMFSSAGSRITRQAKFQANSNAQQRAIYQRMAKGNSLFVNQADNVFRDISRQAQVEMGRWAWSSVFADINNDGWEDLLVANGYISTEDTGDL